VIFNIYQLGTNGWDRKITFRIKLKLLFQFKFSIYLYERFSEVFTQLCFYENIASKSLFSLPAVNITNMHFGTFETVLNLCLFIVFFYNSNSTCSHSSFFAWRKCVLC